MQTKPYAYCFALAVAICLSWVAIERTDFSPEKISIPLLSEASEMENPEISHLLQQPYRFLGKGRQSFVFLSEDGTTVLKFFNQKYFQIPWYASIFPKEKIKRAQRKFFYLNSYELAEKFLSQETALLYSHFGKTHRLPEVCITDRASRSFTLSLNEVPFVLQKKGEAFYPALEEAWKKGGNEALLQELETFLALISRRISLKIADADHDVEHNFGYLEGRAFHIDPGRLYICDFSEKKTLDYEWWRATHALRKWLFLRYPEVALLFDEKLQEAQRQESPHLQKSKSLSILPSKIAIACPCILSV